MQLTSESTLWAHAGPGSMRWVQKALFTVEESYGDGVSCGRGVPRRNASRSRATLSGRAWRNTFQGTARAGAGAGDGAHTVCNVRPVRS